MENRKLAVFCGSRTGNEPVFSEAGKILAAYMVSKNIDLVYGGGKVGLMGVIADEILRLGGKVYGVIPEKLMKMEVGHTGITNLQVVDTMHERKARMANMADAFLAIPGGIGTLEEIIEVFTWQQIGYHNKPCGFLNTNNYYDHLFAFFNQMVNKDFLTVDHKNKLIVEDDAKTIIDRLFPE